MYDSGIYLYIGALCKVRNEQDNIMNSKSLSLGVVLPVGNNTQFIIFKYYVNDFYFFYIHLLFFSFIHQTYYRKIRFQMQ